MLEVCDIYIYIPEWAATDVISSLIFQKNANKLTKDCYNNPDAYFDVLKGTM